MLSGFRRLSVFSAAAVMSASIALTPLGAKADSNPLGYNDGNVVLAPQVYLDFWGPEWTSGFPDNGYSAQTVENYIETYFSDVGGSDWMSTLTQYWMWQGQPSVKTYISNPVNTLNGHVWFDSQTVPSGFTHNDVTNEATRAISYFNNVGEYTAVYFVLTGPKRIPSDMASNTCGYHLGVAYNAFHYAYAYMPYQPTTSGCFNNYVNPPPNDSFGHGYLDGFSITGGHEYAEAITDPGFFLYPFTNTFGYGSGWEDTNGDEIGDKCGNTRSGGPTEQPLFDDVRLGSQYFASQGLWSNALTKCSMGSNYVASTACTSASAWASPASPSLIGTQVTIHAIAYGCPIDLYQFYLLPPGSSSWQLVQPYSTNYTFIWNTAGLTPGTYQFSVWTRDAKSPSNSWDAYAPLTYVLPPQPTGLLIAENSSYTWVAHGTRLEKFNLGGAGPNMFSTSTSGTTGPDALGYFDFGANITAIAVNENYLYIGLSTGRVIKTTMCGNGYNPCQFSDNMGGFTMPGYSYWIGVQDYSLGAVTALAVDSGYLFTSLGSRTVKTGLCTSGGSMCWANSSGTGPISGGGGQYYGFQDWSAPVIAQAANDSYVFTSMYGNGLTRVCKTGLGSTGSDVFALSSGACTGNYPGYADWYGYQDMSVPVVGLAADPGQVFWSLGNIARVVQTTMCGSGGNVCAFTDGYGSQGLSGYGYWVGRQDECSGYQESSVTSSLANRGQNPWVDWAFSTGGGMSRIVQALPASGYNMFATSDCTDTGPYPGYTYWVGYQNLSI